MRRTLVAALAAASVAVIGCGGDDDKSSSAPGAKPLTKAEFIAKADVICKDADDKISAIDDKVDALPAGDLKARGSYIGEGTQVFRDTFEKLRALPEPDQDKATLDRYYAASDKLLGILDELRTAAENNDRAAARKLVTDNQSAIDDGKAAAKSYGFKECT